MVLVWCKCSDGAWWNVCSPFIRYLTGWNIGKGCLGGVVVKLHALSPQASFIWDFKPRSTPPYELAISGTLKNSVICIVINFCGPLFVTCVFCMTDTIFAWAVSLIQCLFDSRSAPLSKFILTRAVAARKWEFLGLLPHYVIYTERVWLLHGKRQLQEYKT